MEIVKSLSNTYSLTKFWIITTLISGVSVIQSTELKLTPCTRMTDEA